MYANNIARWIMSYPCTEIYHAFVFLTIYCENVFKFGTFENIINLCETMVYLGFQYHGKHKKQRTRRPGKESHWYNEFTSRYILNKDGEFVCVFSGTGYSHHSISRFDIYEWEVQSDWFKDVNSKDYEEKNTYMMLRYSVHHEFFFLIYQRKIKIELAHYRTNKMPYW